VAVNLADVSERRRFLADMASRGKRGVVLTEGLLIYLSTEEVGQFAEDLSGVASLQRWILDMHSPRFADHDAAPHRQSARKSGSVF